MIQTEEMMKWQADQKELDRKFQQEMRSTERNERQNDKLSDRRWQIKVAILAATLSLTSALIVFLVTRYAAPASQIIINIPPPSDKQIP